MQEQELRLGAFLQAARRTTLKTPNFLCPIHGHNGVIKLLLSKKDYRGF
jgi:hypothetical protein